MAYALTTATSAGSRGPLRALIDNYLDFADANGATYAAMFSMEITAEFAGDSTPPELNDAFAAIVGVVGDGPSSDARAEVLWSASHGLATLARDGRLPPATRSDRVDALVAMVG